MLRISATAAQGRRKKPNFEEKIRFPFVFCAFFLYEPIWKEEGQIQY